MPRKRKSEDLPPNPLKDIDIPKLARKALENKPVWPPVPNPLGGLTPGTKFRLVEIPDFRATVVDQSAGGTIIRMEDGTHTTWITSEVSVKIVGRKRPKTKACKKNVRARLKAKRRLNSQASRAKEKPNCRKPAEV